MNLYLIRHADAEKMSASKSDFDRALSLKGREQIKKAAEGWKKFVPPFDLIASSPLTRALQTAEIIAAVFNYKEKIITDKKISGGSKPASLIDFLRSYKEENIAVVGHEPDMSNNLSSLVSSSGMYAEFRKASLAKISFEGKVRETAGTLEFLIPSEIFK